jgi:hypothetical protein
MTIIAGQIRRPGKGKVSDIGKVLWHRPLNTPQKRGYNNWEMTAATGSSMNVNAFSFLINVL